MSKYDKSARVEMLRELEVCDYIDCSSKTAAVEQGGITVC